ncbi:M56 family metallopeptidase [Streptomyces sp. NPDC002012]|uniref:M56 family metallopeptidase n=1 Tax=unclassified Streptomyces TaxID=2593676 RepID=UPI002E15BDFF|nr:M56 family metallopeptidase [Streptomyces sp. NBC_01224]
MILFLLVPVVLAFGLPPLTRIAVDRLTPVAALVSLTVTTVVLAGCSLAALGALMLSGLLKEPAVAAIGALIHPFDAAPNVLLMPSAALSLGALGVCTWNILRSALRQTAALRRAKSQADTRYTAGDLCIIDTPRPDAYALPGRPSRIVVTTGMLRSLDPAEREALFAHERAHLDGRHHYCLALAELAAHCHPGLRAARDAIQMSAERAADEAAAAVTGDRCLTARAIGRAALATRAAQAHRPSFAPAATSGPVPQRVAALMRAPKPHSRRTLAAVGALLLCMMTASLVGVAAGVHDLHRNVEIAQGEQPNG